MTGQQRFHDRLEDQNRVFFFFSPATSNKGQELCETAPQQQQRLSPEWHRRLQGKPGACSAAKRRHEGQTIMSGERSSMVENRPCGKKRSFSPSQPTPQWLVFPYTWSICSSRKVTARRKGRMGSPRHGGSFSPLRPPFRDCRSLWLNFSSLMRLVRRQGEGISAFDMPCLGYFSRQITVQLRGTKARKPVGTVGTSLHLSSWWMLDCSAAL